MNTNTSATGGGLVQINDNGFLADDALEDFIQGWLVSFSGLDPTMVRPAYQADPPPLPDFSVTWLAFNLKLGRLDWDSSNTHFPSTTSSDGFERTFRSQEIHLALTCYGPLAGGTITRIVMGTGLGQNRELLQRNHFAFVSANEPTIGSEKIKGRFQRRVDLQIQLRRTVQFSYAVLDLASATGEIVSDAPTVEIVVGDYGANFGGNGFGG